MCLDDIGDLHVSKHSHLRIAVACDCNVRRNTVAALALKDRVHHARVRFGLIELYAVDLVVAAPDGVVEATETSNLVIVGVGMKSKLGGRIAFVAGPLRISGYI